MIQFPILSATNFAFLILGSVQNVSIWVVMITNASFIFVPFVSMSFASFAWNLKVGVPKISTVNVPK